MDNAGVLGGFLPIIIIIAIFYLLIILPQSKQAKKRQAMLDALKAGDEVETVGRLFGTVDSIRDDIVILKVGTSDRDSMKIRVHREGIARVVEETPVQGTESK